MCKVDGIKEVAINDLEQLKAFSCHLADCVVLTHDNRLLMQRRPDNWKTYAGVLNIFGGHVEKDETIIEGLIREITEELGATPKQDEVIFIGAISEDFTGHNELVHVHFWHDTDNRITGCYEAKAEYFDNAEQALLDPKIMDYTIWALKKCLSRNLIS